MKFPNFLFYAITSILKYLCFFTRLESLEYVTKIFLIFKALTIIKFCIKIGIMLSEPLTSNYSLFYYSLLYPGELVYPRICNLNN